MIRPAILITLLVIVSPAIGSTLLLNTTPLVSSGSGPFTIDFQFTDGDGIGDGNNTVTLSNFTFGGGSLDPTPTSSSGGVTVDPSPFGVTLTDNSFFNDIQFAFIPGSSLRFDFASTSNADSTSPDSFTFAIFDNSGSEIPTDNPNGFDSFFELDLPTTSSGPEEIASASSGYVVNIAAPTVQQAGSGTPEPSTAALAAFAGAIVLGGRRGRQSSSRPRTLDSRKARKCEALRQ